MPAAALPALLTDWRFEADSVVLVVVALAAYVSGMRRVARRGRRWPARRAAAFVTGLAAVVVATQSPLGTYDTRVFSVHVAQHAVLGMVAPLLVALGAPVTLALQAAARPARSRILRMLRSRPARVLANPLVGTAVFAATMVAGYLTPLLRLSVEDPVLHAAVHLHLFAAGCLFLWPVVAADPVHPPAPHHARLLAVVLTVPLHAVVGIAVLGADRLLAGDAYAATGPAWAGSPMGDQRTAGGLLWLSGDLFGVLVAALVAVAWVRDDERGARREDRRLDAAGAGYRGRP